MKMFCRPLGLALFAVLLCSFFNATAAESPAVKRLEGTWVGDGEGTAAWMQQSGKFQPAYIETVKDFLGKMRVTYRTDGTVIIGSGNSAPREVLWRIVREGRDRLEVQSMVAPAAGGAVDWSNALRSVIEFEDGDRALWVSWPSDPTGLRERFIKEPLPETRNPKPEAGS